MWNMADISVADVIKSSLQQKLLSKCNSILRFTDSNSIWFNPKKRVRFGRTRPKILNDLVVCLSYNLFATSEPPKYLNSPNLCFDFFNESATINLRQILD